MAEDDQDSTTFHTSSEESQQLAQQAFGGEATETPVAMPTTPAAGGPTATPAGIPSTTQTAIPGAPRRRRFPRGCLVGFVILDVVVVLGIGMFFLVKGATKSDDKSQPAFSVPAIPGAPTIPAIPSTPDEPASPQKPAASDFFTTAGLRAGKAQAQRLAGAGARIQLARITQDQIQVIARSGSANKVVIISPAITRAITSPGGSLSGNEFRFSNLNPAVAGRLTRAINRRYHVPPSSIDYMVVLRDPIDKQLQWLVYPRSGGSHFEANAGGGALRRVG